MALTPANGETRSADSAISRTWRKMTRPMRFGVVVALPSAIAFFAAGAFLYPADYGAHVFATIAGVFLEAAVVVLVLEKLAQGQQKSEWRFVRHTVALRVAATMVDVIRLGSVRWSEIGYRCDANRYDEFRAVADRHLTDLRFNLWSLVLGLAPAEYREAREIEQLLGTLVDYLRQLPPQAGQPYEGEWLKLIDTVKAIEPFLRYDESLKSALDAGRRAAALLMVTAPISIDEFFERRLEAQNNLAEPGGEPPRIRYDVTGELAVKYFAIDSTLLEKIPQQGA